MWASVLVVIIVITFISFKLLPNYLLRLKNIHFHQCQAQIYWRHSYTLMFREIRAKNRRRTHVLHACYVNEKIYHISKWFYVELESHLCLWIIQIHRCQSRLAHHSVCEYDNYQSLSSIAMEANALFTSLNLLTSIYNILIIIIIYWLFEW